MHSYATLAWWKDRRVRKSLPALLIVGALSVLAVPAASEVVSFPSASVPPTPLRQRLARERGEIAQAEPGIEITGELLRPAGNGPFPALVMLHGCGGPSPKTDPIKAERYVSWGYAALRFDSFAPRGIKNMCNGAVADRAQDALGALDYLAHLSFIDPRRIAVVGFSQGGGAALAAINLNDAAILSASRFRAAVLYYPSVCPSEHHNLLAPVLVLIGERDDWTPARTCRAELATREGKPGSVSLIAYPGAFHSFDAIGLKDRAKSYFGYHLEYSESADLAAQLAMHSFLAEALTP